ncbi:MAG: hypothetical protein QG588_452, partial [Candidatus Poribacteria bacterium]|nr:hypothetical protein [Candidatus Poribacteria bacterium]
MIIETMWNLILCTSEKEMLVMSTHSQVARTVGRNGWLIVDEEVTWNPSETAIIIVDMWNQHWSWGATERVGIMAPRMNQVIKTAKDRGIMIVHAPS